jgi:hypothetical protein
MEPADFEGGLVRCQHRSRTQLVDPGRRGDSAGEIEIEADDLRYWLKSQRAAPNKQKALGKRPRVKKQLAEMFSGGVPDPGGCPRKDLRAELLKRDPSLQPLNEETLKRSIEEFNASRRSDSIRNGIVSE